MQTINQVFSISNRVLAVVEHGMLRRANLAFTLQQPFAWSLINTAAVLARMLDDEGYTAEDIERGVIRDKILASEMNVERIDQLTIKLATLRHFNRLACGSNDIGMGTINACLKPEEGKISLEDIKNTARERVKIERRMGKLKAPQVAARFNELVTSMYETEVARKRQAKRLMNEVFFLCNRSEDMLFVGNYEQQLEAHTAYRDAELADFDGFGYLADALAEKCVEPVIRAKSELQALMDRSYRSQVLSDGMKLMAEIDKLAIELGINFAKIDAQNAAIDAEIAAAEHAEAQDDAAIDAAIDGLDIDVAEEVPEARERHVVKSEARLQREAEETRAAQQRQVYDTSMAWEKAAETQPAPAPSKPKRSRVKQAA